jgi:putative NAD(P)H nitroreductase
VVEEQVRKGVVRPEDASGLAASVLRVYHESDWARMLLAVRNPCFVAMAIMLLATERGIATCPLGGFSEPDLRRAFHIPDRYVPLLLIAMGMRSTTVQQPPRAARFPITELVIHEDMGI